MVPKIRSFRPETNYHFGTKQQLINTIFLRRVEPVNQRRLALLEEIERKARSKPPSVEALVDALIRPAVPFSPDQPQGWELFLRLAGRFFSEPNAETNQLIRTNLDKVLSPFTTAFLRALPKLPREELLWRLQFTLSGLHHLLLTLGNKNSMPSLPGKILSGEELVRRIVSFAVAGIKAQVYH